MAVQDYYDLFQKYGAQYGVDPKLLMAVAQQESSGDPNAVSPKTKFGTASGLMGILDSTAQSGGVDPKNPEQSIAFAAKTLASNIKQTGGDVPTALKLYYGGPDQKNWGPKTASYPDQVSARYASIGAPEEDDSGLLDALKGKSVPAPEPPEDTHLLTALRGAPPPTTKTAGKPGMLESVNAGAVQGMRDVASSLDPIAQWIDKKIPGAAVVDRTLGGALGLPTADQAATNNALARKAYEASPGANTLAGGVGRAGGELAGSLPFLAAGGEVMGPLAGGIRAAAPAAAPVVDFLAGTGGGASRLLRGASMATQGALQGVGANALISSTSDAPIGDQLRQGAEFGGAVGVGAPLAARLGGEVVQHLTGGGISPERAALAQKAIDLGIPLRGSQISNSPVTKLLDAMVSRIPLSGMGRQNDEQLVGLTRAVASTFGEPGATGLTPEVMSRARERIGNMFNDVAANTTIDAKTLPATLNNVLQNANMTVTEGELTPLKNQVENVISKIDPKTGTISGEAYQALTRKNAPLDRALNSSNSNIRQFGGDIRDALDDALQQSASPEDLSTLRTARLQWKNMKTVEDLAKKANIEGEISPGLLLGAVRKSYKDMAYSGAGQLGDIAKISDQFLKQSPNSLTAEKLALLRGVEGGGAAGLAAFDLYNPTHIATQLGAAGAIVGGGRLVGAALRSPLYRSAMINSALRGGVGPVNPLLAGAVNDYGVPATVFGANQLLNRPSQ